MTGPAAASCWLGEMHAVPRLLDRDDEDEGADGGGSEEQGAVLLDFAGLHPTEQAAGAFLLYPMPLTAPSTTRWSTLRYTHSPPSVCSCRRR